MKKMNKLLLLTLLGIFISSCEPDDNVIDQYQPKGSYDSGVLVLNEGNFQSGDASVSYISFDLSSTQNNIFSAANNGIALGDTGQSLAFNGDLAYIVVNNSDKIEVVNRYTMKKVGTISSGLDSPRYMAFANGKGYVTNWADPNPVAPATPIPSFVSVINLTNNSVESKIICNNYPEKIIEYQGKLYVAHDNYATGNTISIINSTNNSLEGTPIEVAYGPNSLTIVNGFLWVSCSGKGTFPVAAEESTGRVFKIRLADKTFDKQFAYTAVTDHIDKFQIYNGNAYYTKAYESKFYKFSLTQTSTNLPTSSIFTSTIPNIYGFGISNNRIYMSGYESFSANGVVTVYSLGEVSDSPAVGTVLRTTGVGVGPNGFYFNQ
jgi:hypothetical protein